ncbi:MAG: hypothetical protein CMJ18_27370 [Phycisphaeraceae bacterium]|nr:hypothetical protein [Phycisphaeraceae bacterium]
MTLRGRLKNTGCFMLLLFAVTGCVNLRVPEGFRAAPNRKPEPYTRTGWAHAVIHEKTGIEMVFIPAGTFEIGSPESDAGRSVDEGPVRSVRLTQPFYLARYEVTQDQWLEIMGDNPSRFEGKDRPVECVSWDACQQFLQEAGNGLSLPTEAQWEYACRAGTTTAFFFADAFQNYFGDDQGLLGRHAWFDGNSDGRTHPVGLKAPNPWGLHDIIGNVWEWCEDGFADARNVSPDGLTTDPVGPTDVEHRVLRGGSWLNLPWLCRSAFRNMAPPQTRSMLFGFRVAAVPSD